MAGAHGIRERLAKVVISGIIVITAAFYVSGSLLLWSIGGKAYTATPLTSVRYFYYYREVPAIRRRIIGKNIGGGS